jgi:ArsR family transcriptional regulator, arsenate/arsenite/antimonite-responsive transcriptional repressor
MQRQISESRSFHQEAILLRHTKSAFPATTGFETHSTKCLTIILYFQYYRSVSNVTPAQIARFADMFSAMGTEARLRIMQLLMTAEPKGMVVGDIQSAIDIPNSTLSHHLDKLKNENLVTVRREGTYLWYRANTEALKDLLGFLYAECCTRNHVVAPKDLVSISK